MTTQKPDIRLVPVGMIFRSSTENPSALSQMEK